MASRYWVGGTDTWDGTALLKWSTTSGGIGGAAVPTTSDDVFFDANSGASTITISGSRSAGSFICTGFTGTITGSSLIAMGTGNFLLVSGMTWSFTGTIQFSNNSSNAQITTAGKTIGVMNFSFNGSSFQLQDDLTLSSTLLFGSTATLDGNSKIITCGGFAATALAYTLNNSGGSLIVNGTFQHTGGASGMSCNVNTLTISSTFAIDSGAVNVGSGGFSATTVTLSGATAKAIDMGTGTWTLSGTGTVWNYSGSNLTLTENTSTISLTDISASAKTFAGNGETYYNISLTAGNTGRITFTGANTFNNFTIGAPNVFRFTASTTTTINGTMDWTGSSGNVITLDSSSAGTAATISKASGTVNADWLSLKDSAAIGGATFYAGNNSTNVSGNSGWIFTGIPGASQIIMS